MEFNYLKNAGHRYSAQVNDLVEELQQPFSTKSRLKDVKDYLGRVFEDVLRKEIGEKYMYGGKYQSIPEEVNALDLTMTMMHHAGGKIKKINALRKKGIDHECLNVAIKILEEGAEISTMAKAAVIQKKEVVKEPSPKDVIAKNIHNEAFAMLLDNTQELEEDLSFRILRSLNDFTDKRIEQSSGYPHMIQKYIEDKEKVNPVKAKKEAELIIESFVAKNILKISPVIKDRQLKDVKGSFSLRGTSIEGNLAIKLNDDSEFRVTMTTEFSISNKGTPFVRYPTRFHDAYDANNKKILNPSQNRLSNKL